MPAPQSSAMKPLARVKFTSYSIKVPTNWKAPQGQPGDHYGRAFKQGEMNTVPGIPPLFQAASANKYHTDTQKMLIGTHGSYMDAMCEAICSAWSQWQQAATLVGVVVNAVTAVGGQVVGPPMGPLILASAPKDTPQKMKYANAIANTLSTVWLSYTGTMKVAGMPWYPAFAAFPGPVAPPMPNVPCPVKLLNGVCMPPDAITNQMVGMLGDPQAPYHKELFASIVDAFDKMRTIWEGTCMVTNVLGTGPIPTFAPPYVPVGPVVGGIANMMPGGFV